MQRAFTTRFPRKVNVLKTEAGICLPFDRSESSQKIRLFNYLSIWDTGATNSVITKRVVEDLDLKPIRVTEAYHAGGKSIVNVYLVNIALPDNMMVENVTVTQGELTEEYLPENQRACVLVGMDIIGLGDFAITNFNNKTMLSFRVPSAQEIDFVPHAQEHNIITSGNRKQRRTLTAKKRHG